MVWIGSCHRFEDRGFSRSSTTSCHLSCSGSAAVTRPKSLTLPGSSGSRVARRPVAEDRHPKPGTAPAPGLACAHTLNEFQFMGTGAWDCGTNVYFAVTERKMAVPAAGTKTGSVGTSETVRGTLSAL